MKKIVKLTLLRFAATAVLSAMSLFALAQEKGLDVDINVNEKKEWYSQPWVWVIGGAVFILILVALLRGKKNA
jgi:hypothetical protein